LLYSRCFPEDDISDIVDLGKDILPEDARWAQVADKIKDHHAHASEADAREKLVSACNSFNADLVHNPTGWAEFKGILQEYTKVCSRDSATGKLTEAATVVHGLQAALVSLKIDSLSLCDDILEVAGRLQGIARFDGTDPPYDAGMFALFGTWQPLVAALKWDEGQHIKGSARFDDKEWLENLKVAIQAFATLGMTASKLRGGGESGEAMGMGLPDCGLKETMMRAHAMLFTQIQPQFLARVEEMCTNAIAAYADCAHVNNDAGCTKPWHFGSNPDASASQVVKLVSSTLLKLDATKLEQYGNDISNALKDLHAAYELFGQEAKLPELQLRGDLEAASRAAQVDFRVAMIAHAYETFKAQPTTLVKRLYKQRQLTEGSHIEGDLPIKLWADVLAKTAEHAKARKGAAAD